MLSCSLLGRIFQCVLHTPLSGPDPSNLFGNEACRFKRFRRNTEAVIRVWSEGIHTPPYRRHTAANGVYFPRGVWIVKIFEDDEVAVEITFVVWYRDWAHGYSECVVVEGR